MSALQWSTVAKNGTGTPVGGCDACLAVGIMAVVVLLVAVAAAFAPVRTGRR